jgi:hypothetical protein
VTDLGFVIAGFTGILGGLAVYAGTLAWRLRAARREADAQDREAAAGNRTPPGSE